MSLKAIIPCAGYGKRMNMKPNESKEMLKEVSSDAYLIDYSLDLCYSNNIEPVVISRIEKEDLNSYLRSQNVEHIVLKTPGKEWADTVLKSQGLWGDKNILILPDTRFTPANESIKRIVDSLNEYDLVAGIHQVTAEDSRNWGIITRRMIQEKPIGLGISGEPKTVNAWGILGFTEKVGKRIFSQLQGRHTYADLSASTYYNREEIVPAFVHLDSFKDITRSGVLEKY